MKGLRAVVMAAVLAILMVGVAQATPLVLSGNVLTVGVSEGGGLVNLGAGQGITYIPAGFPNDFTLPGTPWEFYSLGFNGDFVVGGVAGGNLNPIGVVTYDVSSPTNLAAHTNSHSVTIGGATLRYDQTVSFDKDGNVISFKADFFNSGTVTATDVVYARGLDPDQEANQFGMFATDNYFLGPGSVVAQGVNSGLAIRIDDLTSGFAGKASISDSSPEFPWATDPYLLAAGGLVNGAMAGNPFDYSINIAWLIGDILPGHSVEIDWSYTFYKVPEPGLLLLLGLGLGALGVFSRRKKL